MEVWTKNTERAGGQLGASASSRMLAMYGKVVGERDALMWIGVVLVSVAGVLAMCNLHFWWR